MTTLYLLTFLAGLILSYRAGYRAGQEDVVSELHPTQESH